MEISKRNVPHKESAEKNSTFKSHTDIAILKTQQIPATTCLKFFYIPLWIMSHNCSTALTYSCKESNREGTKVPFLFGAARLALSNDALLPAMTVPYVNPRARVACVHAQGPPVISLSALEHGGHLTLFLPFSTRGL